MAIVFQDVVHAPLDQFSVTAPDGAVVGLAGLDGAGKRLLLRLTAGLEQPSAGEVQADAPRRLLGPGDPLNLAPVKTLLLNHALAQHDAVVRARAAIGLERLRRDGATILLLSHEEELLRSLSDEIWWIHEGKLAAKGDPEEVLERYRRHVAQRLREWGSRGQAPLMPSMRRGDGRARLLSLETLGEDGRPAQVWRAGESASVRVTVRFEADVENPVVGIMIRTRIGFEVYGTNTELEKLKLGPCQAGETRVVTFQFPCELCPREYTITAASHDPDGVWHNWAEDAVAFSVADSRYTAGVANLRARVTFSRE